MKKSEEQVGKTPTKKAKVTTKKAKEIVKSTNLIVIDASGSMGNKINDVKGGLKQLFKDIKKDAILDKGKKTIQTIVVDFSSAGDIRVLVNSTDGTQLNEDLAEDYKVRGSTALYDAIGYGFSLVDSADKNVFVSILTDGEENSSREFTHMKIKQLIEEKKKAGWAITFMGTTEAAIDQAKSWGIGGGNTMQFQDSSRGMGQTVNSLSNARRASYTMSSAKGFDFMTDYEGLGGEKLRASVDSLLSSQEDILDKDLAKVKQDKKNILTSDGGGTTTWVKTNTDVDNS